LNFLWGIAAPNYFLVLVCVESELESMAFVRRVLQEIRRTHSLDIPPPFDPFLLDFSTMVVIDLASSIVTKGSKRRR